MVQKSEIFGKICTNWKILERLEEFSKWSVKFLKNDSAGGAIIQDGKCLASNIVYNIILQ